MRQRPEQHDPDSIRSVAEVLRHHAATIDSAAAVLSRHGAGPITVKNDAAMTRVRTGLTVWMKSLNEAMEAELKRLGVFKAKKAGTDK